MIAHMNYGDHVTAVEREVAALAGAFAAGPIDIRVPTCPEWTVADLADHVGGFTGFWSHVLCEGTGRPKPEFTERPANGDLGAWYAQLGASLVAELKATAAEQQVWTWVPGQNNASFVARRCAHELAIHRFDAQAARAATAPIDGALAVDGIEEVFVLIEAWKADGHPESGAGQGRNLAFHRSDVVPVVHVSNHKLGLGRLAPVSTCRQIATPWSRSWSRPKRGRCAPLGALRRRGARGPSSRFPE